MKAMPYTEDGDMKIGFFSGVVCGIWKLLDIYLLADPYAVVLVKVLLTGVIGGFGGVAGKYLFSYMKDKIKKKNK